MSNHLPVKSPYLTYCLGEDSDLPPAKVFIVSWVDYCNKYGMGYALTDGSVGVHFNDSTSVVLSADKQYVIILSHLICEKSDICSQSS